MPTTLPRLDDNQRLRWEEHLQRLLDEKDLQRNKVFARLSLKDAPSAATMTRFCQGHPGTLEGFLVRNGGRLGGLLEKVLGLPEGALLKKLHEIASGPAVVKAAPWHPSFPDLDAATVEIESPVVSPLGSTIQAVVTKLMEEHGTSGAMIHVVGGAGSGRKTLVRQLGAALSRAGALVAEAPGPGAFALKITGSDRLRSSEDIVVRPRPWGRDEALALLDRLVVSGSAQAPQAAQIVGQFRADPTIPVPSNNARRLIEWIADVLDEGIKDDPCETARKGAWRRAVRSDPTGTLDRLGEPVLERFWARVLRIPSCPDWTTLPAEAAREHLDATLTVLGRDPLGAQPALLIAKVRKGSRKARTAALNELEAVLARSPARLLDLMIEAGLLTKRGADVAAPDEAVALSFGVRGLIAEAGAGPAPGLFVGEQGELLARELAYGHAPPPLVERWIAAQPAWAALDVSRALVLFAAASAQPVSSGAIRPAWAASILAALLEPRELMSVGSNGVGVEGSLSKLTRSAVDLLPKLTGSNPLEELLNLAPACLRPQLTDWRSKARSQDGAEVGLVDLCPIQRAPFAPEVWTELTVPQREAAVRAIVERALRDPECARALDGSSIAADANAEWYRWKTLPLEARVRWLGQSRGARPDEVGRVGSILLREALPESKEDAYLDQLATPDLEPAVEALLAKLSTAEPESDDSLDLDPINKHLGVRIRLAGRRRDAAGLAALADRALILLAGVRLVVTGRRHVQVRTQGLLQTLVPNPVEVFKHLAELRRRLDLVHESAAVELHKLDEPERLLARWQSSLVVQLPDQLAEDERTAMVIADADGLHAAVDRFLDVPVPADAATRFLQGREVARGPHALELERLAKVLGGTPSKPTRLAMAVLDALDGEVDPRDLPPELSKWLSAVTARVPTLRRTLLASAASNPRFHAEQAAQDAAHRAELLLLALGNPEPVRRWLGAADDQPSRAIEEQVASGRLTLDRLWNLATSDAERARVLPFACRRVGKGADAPSWLVEAGVSGPREAGDLIATTLVPALFDPFAAKRAVVTPRAPTAACERVLRRLFKSSLTAREACWWAARLHDVRPWPLELYEALRRWAGERAPFASPAANSPERWDSDLWPMHLATLVSEIPADRYSPGPVADVLERVWTEAVKALERGLPFLQRPVLDVARALRARGRLAPVSAAYRDRGNRVLRSTLGEWILELLDLETIRAESRLPDGGRERWFLARANDKDTVERAARQLHDALAQGDRDATSASAQLLAVASPAAALASLSDLVDDQPEAVGDAVASLAGWFDGPLEGARQALRRRAASTSRSTKPPPAPQKAPSAATPKRKKSK